MSWTLFFIHLIPLLCASLTGACFSAYFVNRAWKKAVERGMKSGMEDGVKKASNDFWQKYHSREEWKKK